MDFLVGFLVVWLICGVSMLVSNTKDLSLLAKKILPITRPWQSFVYAPLWWIICIVLIIIYPAFYIRGSLLKVYTKHFKNKAEQ
jgi:hypothetical protein